MAHKYFFVISGLPNSFTNRQLYMLLGNSLNVHVVSVLIQLMVTDTD